MIRKMLESFLHYLTPRPGCPIQGPGGYARELLDTLGRVPIKLWLCSRFFLCYAFSRYDFHRDEANYHCDVYVDDLD
jgi:hypothetical protein